MFLFFSLQYADSSTLSCKIFRWLGVSLICASYNQQLLLTIDRVIAMRHFTWYRRRLMNNFIYPALGTIFNLVFTILAYLPFIFLMELKQPFNVCTVGEENAQKFQLLFASYAVFFSISPLTLNIVLNAYITRKMR